MTNFIPFLSQEGFFLTIHSLARNFATIFLRKLFFLDILDPKKSMVDVIGSAF